MARRIESRLRIRGKLVAETPLHVGGFGESPDTDLPLAQNGRGEWYVPGTSIAGTLRSQCERNFGAALTDSLFAWRARETDKNQKAEELEQRKHASFVLIEDAIIENAEDAVSEIRDGVGIDRFYGVAAEKAKFDRAILPRGTRLNFVMTVEIAENQNPNQSKAIVRQLLEALTKSRVRFGAAKTRGLGRMKLKDCKIKEEEFKGFDAIIRLLKDGNEEKRLVDWRNVFESSLSEEEKTELGKLRRDQPQLSIELTWKSRLPVMVKAGYDGIGVDMLPLTSSVDKGKVALVLPGSSIKGVLRSHAERIIRTVLPDCDCTKDKPNFHEQIDSIPLVEELFGARSKSEKEQSNTQQNKKCQSNKNAKLGLGALAIDDCYAKELHNENDKKETYWMNTNAWRKVEAAPDEKPKTQKGDQSQKEQKTEAGEVSYFERELWRYLREIDEQKETLTEDQYKEPTERFGIEHHVAIDRWTGGAADGALYSVLAPKKVEWEPMRFTLDFNRISEDSRLPALMLLLLTFRDVTENRLPFGFATNRGMGEIEVTAFEFTGSGKFKVKKVEEENGEVIERDEEIDVDLKDALSATVENGKCKFADGVLKEQLQMRWKKWLK